jgi:two-component system, chemotaxis family, response regulator PixG
LRTYAKYLRKIIVMSGSLVASDLEEKIQHYRSQQFTGLVKVNGQNGHQWVIYYLLGRIVWTKSRIHSLRRWQRHLAIHSPVFFEQITQPVSLSYESWNYASLARLVKLKQFRRDQFSKVVESCIIEDLFDILQVGTVQQAQLGKSLSHEVHSKEASVIPFIMLQQELVWQDAQQEWLVWEQAGLAKFSPDWAPTITQLETLREQTPPQTFQTLTTFVDGQNTLRDLASKFRQPIIPLTKSILPYVSRKMLGLIEIPDLVENASHGFGTELLAVNNTVAEQTPLLLAEDDVLSIKTNQHPLLPNISPRPNTQSLSQTIGGTEQSYHKTPLNRKLNNKAPRIIYIDDSPADSRAMCEIVEELGYQYSNISDPLQALPLLIEYKPKLIFLDLVMPIANGYEVCSQIRRISALKEIPVIIVTSNDGIADRVRARLVGASGFLGKPIQHKKVAKVIRKHLRHVPENVPVPQRQDALSIL